MRPRLGIHVGQNDLRAVLLRGDAVVALASCVRSPSAPLRDQLKALFATLPPAPMPDVVVALEPPAAWSKLLTDLPRLRDARLLEQVVQENADQYFLGDTRTRVLAVRSGTDGLRVDAYDLAVVTELRDALIGDVARTAFVVSAVSLPLFELSDLAAEFRVARCAALADSRRSPSLPISGTGAAAKSAWRARTATGLALSAGLFLLASPIIGSRRIAAAAREEIESVSPAYLTASRTINNLDTVNARLRQVGVARGSVQVTLLLSQITRALPRNAAMIAFAYDSAKGSAVLLSTSVVNVLPALDSVAHIASVRLSGPITRERIGDRELERATILMTWGSGR